MDQEYFEKYAGRKVQGYRDINRADDVYVWWIFYNDGTAKWVQINRLEVMSHNDQMGTMCTTTNNPRIYAAVSFGVSRYYFNDKQEKQK